MSDLIITKHCSRCKQIKPVAAFHKNKSTKDGYYPQCRTCVDIYNHSLSAKKNMKKYLKSPKGRLYIKNRLLTEKGKITRKKGRDKYRKNYPEKIKAVMAVNNAVRSKKLSPPFRYHCRYCWKPAEQYHHYLGYSTKHWFDIIPICKPCHYKIHSKT